MSKSAIEKYSDCLRMEMKKWGISVSIIEPVAFRTGKISMLHVINYVINRLCKIIKYIKDN